MAAKIFVIGNVNGQLESAFAKLTALHSKNNFSLALVVGNLFGEQDDGAVTNLLEGKIEVPVSTYFTVGNTALPSRIVEKIEKDEEICPNLHYLGKRSVTKTSDGIRIATLGGILDPDIVGGQSKEQYLPLHTPDDAKSLKGANSADILLTTMWPSGVWNGSGVALPFDPASITGSDAVADLCAALKPRYHFSPSYSDFFFEREPFFHPLNEEAADAEVEKQYTRFISMATYGNAAKAKAMYAFTLQTGSTAPASSTPSPFLARESRKRRPPQDAAFSRFSNGNDHDRRPRHLRKKRQGAEPLSQDQCFLCLANAAADIKTVVLIGESTYLATAKGPLSTSETFAEHGIDFPAHMMIVTVDHNPRISRATMAGEEADNTFKEMTRFRDSLQAMVSTKSKHKLGGVTWEINRAANIHAHWQFMPVSSNLIRKGLVEAAFRVEAENLKLPKLQVKDFGISDEVQGDYVRIWIWHEEDDEGADGGRIASKSLLMHFDENVRFDLQYPRKVMAKLMGLEKRIYWQDCVQDDDEEQRDAEAVRTAMKPWDFTEG
ncbi:putative cwfj domain-containing protein [Phaeoacremonium minimum UCRPA7]|uniref:Putative cwfj domain-containing protein n=1 Tax=Phaeoacremonium minimum (strain UCR-PA7) TaxID=1286976 RepID=R8BM74_PHAM7|nr:putative cwfj domain-containing protein [Phaeoacremonium minimum UCRPA7]EOO00481.1 putative cwfj domain-containing protein [Phaeoacremonium minimum UCRPA7]